MVDVRRLCLVGVAAPLLWSCSLAHAAESPKQVLTVAAAIETTRILPTVSRFSSASGTWEKQDVAVSPDGRRYAVMLVRGDVGRNGLRMELRVGGLESLQAAKDFKIVASLFTRGLGPFPITYRFDYKLTWLPDSRRLAFLAEAPDGTIQVAVADVVAHTVRFVTTSQTDVAYFDVNSRGDVLFTTAAAPSKAAADALLHEGFAVTDLDARGLMSGFPNGTGRTSFSYFLCSEESGFVARAIEIEGGSQNQIPPQLISFSPDGQRAILDSTPPAATIPQSWVGYSDPLMSLYAKEASQPGGGRAWIIQRLYVLDVKRRIARPLWNAPKQFVTNRVAWSPDGQYIALGPTFLPLHASSAAGAAGSAIAVVDVATGQYTELAVPAGVKGEFHVTGWRNDGALELESADTAVTFARVADQWALTGTTARKAQLAARGPIRVTVREDMHSPPRLVAFDMRSKRHQIVFDLNPGLFERYSLGAVEMVDWQDKEGRVWKGRLYYPVGFDSKRRYPLIVQSGGMAPITQFSLYGPGGPGYVPGLGPPGMSIYAAQALANRGIAVLQVEDKLGEESADFRLSPREPQVYAGAYEAAVANLAKRGWIDPTKVGLSGFSRSGWYVEYALTHSHFPYAAALVSDNLNGGYLQASLIGAAGGLTGEFAQDNGAVGIGEGLKVWLQTAPAFNAHRVRTPLRKQVESGGLPSVVLQWEMFNALALLERPIELYVVPDVEHGSHNLQNPKQVIASAEGAVDWFDFWLNGREDPVEGKVDQYRRWRNLRAKVISTTGE